MAPNKEAALSEIRRLLRKYSRRYPPEQNRLYRIPLSAPSYGWKEEWEVVDSMLTGSVTMGKKVSKFEANFASYLGVEHAVMVNSGSSANLVALWTLALDPKSPLKPGSEVVTSATTWPTTVFSILNIGATPVFVDVDPSTYNISTARIERAVSKRTKAVLPVHVLGNPCDLDVIQDIANRNELIMVEDACDSLGAEYHGTKAGTYGDVGTFSFFFSHHLTTVEGGMIVTNNAKRAELARSLRAHGWLRDSPSGSGPSEAIHIDRRFLFAWPGFNFRPTEFQGGFGIHQLNRLDEIVRKRRELAKYWIGRLSKFSEFFSLPREREGTKHSWLGFPITIRPSAPFTRDEFAAYLEDKGIETRPLLTGDITLHPAMKGKPFRAADSLTHSKAISSRSLFWGNHQSIDRERRAYLVNTVSEFVESRAR